MLYNSPAHVLLADSTLARSRIESVHGIIELIQILLLLYNEQLSISIEGKEGRGEEGISIPQCLPQ